MTTSTIESIDSSEAHSLVSSTVSSEAGTGPDCSPCETGSGNLLMGAGIGSVGTLSYLATGVVCPSCLIFTPALLGLGWWQRRAWKRQQAPIRDEDAGFQSAGA
ncbi:MAG: hypothetical protein RQ899_00535 [Pseudomonadales bacterium]|nr:hypothetical protein [Pseudomonadales bacterium]